MNEFICTLPVSFKNGAFDGFCLPYIPPHSFQYSRLRHGRAGGSWRHVKEVLQAGGARIVFVDGKIST